MTLSRRDCLGNGRIILINSTKEMAMLPNTTIAENALKIRPCEKLIYSLYREKCFAEVKTIVNL